MLDIAKISAVFALIVFLLRRKVKIGHVMLLGSAALAALSLMPPGRIIESVGKSLVDPVTLKLVLALSLIRMFELLLREHNVLAEMMAAFKSLFRSRKAVVVSMPLLIGMLPSVGGAYFSAPMVEESTRGLPMSPEEKGFINYWYRHPWEYVLPLYPGLLLASAVSGMEVRSLMLLNFPFAAVLFAGGFLASMRGMKEHPSKRGVSARGLASFIPVGSVLVLVMAFHVNLSLALLAAVAGLLAFYRHGARDLLRVARHGFSLDVAVLIAGVMIFKGMMESSGLVENLSLFFSSRGIPLMPTLLSLPLVAGLLTGLTVGFVGATFPLLVSLDGGSASGAVAFAFACGFIGVLFSPVHVCLVLTREYFKADMGGIYRRMLLPAALVMAVAVAEYLFLSSRA